MKNCYVTFVFFAIMLDLLTGCANMTHTPRPASLPLVPTEVRPLSTPGAETRNQSSDMDSLMAGMSLERKVGQIMIIGIEGMSFTSDMRRMIEQVYVGGVILYEDNIGEPSQLAQLNADLQQAARQSGQPGLLICIDQEGGPVTRMRESKGYTEFPSQMAIAATGDVENVRRAARAIAAELEAVGINMDLTPVLDVNNNPHNPIIGARSFSSDPQRVAEYGAAFIEAMQSEGILAIGKHFPGHGDTSIDSHVSLPTVPHNRARLEAVEFVPFKAAMRANVAGIMSAHITFPAIDPTPGRAATLSPPVLTGLLRGEMNYDGLLMTDSLVMGALKASGYPAPQAALAALQAGADLLLFHGDYAQHREAHKLIVDKVRSGEISPARLDEAVRRVLTAKRKFGILTQVPKTNLAVGTAEVKAVSRDIAAQSITLLRDDAHLIPLPANSKLLVVETAKGIGLGKALGATAVEVNSQPKPSDVSMVLGMAREGRLVIVATTDVLKNTQQADLVNALLREKIPTVVVAVRGPYDLMNLRDVPTYLASYGSNPPSIEALAAVLMGKVKPRGRLPVELPGLYKIGEGM